MALEISGLVATYTQHYDALLDAAARIICRAMGDICVIGLLSDDRRKLHPLGIHHLDPAIQQELDSGRRIAWDPSHGVSEQVLATGEPSIFGSVDMAGARGDRGWVKAFVDGANMHSAVVVAMRVSGAPNGVVAVARRAASPPMCGEDVPFVQGVADRLALVVENISLKEEIVRLRRSDAGQLPDPRLAALTPRELEILKLIGEGMTNRDIGAHLYLSARTVEWHRGRLSAKLGEHKRSALIALGRTLVG
jgi:DNA-binding CsgD family transcriptional regulator